MIKTERIIILIAVSISLIMSVIALRNSLPRAAGIDYVGVVVGILSLLVTTLIGWNIYTVVDFNRNLEKVRNDAKLETSKTIKSYRHTIKAIALFLHAVDFYNRNITEVAVDEFIAAIDEGMKGEDPFPMSSALEYLYNMAEKGVKIMINKGEKQHYLLVLSRCNDERALDVIKMISEANEKSG